MSLIKLTDISRVYGYGEAAVMALDQVSLDIKKGEFVAIMGPSGSGKSTLMNIIGLLDRPTTGVYHFDDRDVSELRAKKRALIRREKIGFIFQSFNLLPRITSVENVALPLTYRGIGYVDRLEKAAEMMKKVDLEMRQYYMPNQLSGGQIQRVAIARAMVNDPEIILADEPTGNLDSESGENIMHLLQEINRAGNTIVMVTHDHAWAKFAKRIVTMKDGRIHSDRMVVGQKKAKKSVGKTSETVAKSKKGARK